MTKQNNSGAKEDLLVEHPQLIESNQSRIEGKWNSRKPSGIIDIARAALKQHTPKERRGGCC